MRYRDLRSLDERALECDLCIVGSGPAGLTVARQFAGGPIRVLVVESGDREERVELNALNELESVGAPRQPDQSLVRTRIFGGTSHVWTGRCAVLDDIDFEARPWVPLSGWPIERAELATHLHRAADWLGLLRVDYDVALESRLDGAALRWATHADQVRPFVWQYSQDPQDPSVPWRGANSLDLPESDNLQVLLNATAIEIAVDPNGTRAEWLEVADLTGKRVPIRARAFVLCAGAIETPRLLLASRRVIPEGVGNRYDQVGRYLADHPRSRIGQFDPSTAGPVMLRFGMHRLSQAGRVREFMRGLALSPELQRREQLLNCGGWVRPEHADDDPWNALKRLRRRSGGRRQTLRDVETIMTQPRLFARQLSRRVVAAQPVVHKVSAIDFLCDVEQAPDPTSRLTLSERCDAFGVPRVKLDWRIGELERRTVQRFAQVTAEAFAAMGLTAPVLDDSIRSGRLDETRFIDVAHPSGTTRMSSDATRGVVDRNCQVHGVERLYSVGGAVLPTNGHVNPTLTIVALAMRLADWLQRGPLRA